MDKGPPLFQNALAGGGQCLRRNVAEEIGLSGQTQDAFPSRIESEKHYGGLYALRAAQCFFGFHLFQIPIERGVRRACGRKQPV